MTSLDTNNLNQLSESSYLETITDIETYLSENKYLKEIYESAQQLYCYNLL